MAAKKALVVGASGINGSHICMELVKQGWQVLGTATSEKNLGYKQVKLITVDLLDRNMAEAALKSELPGLTHLFYCALIAKPNEPEKETDLNLTMLRNSVELAEQYARETLRSVFLLTGTKYYGVHEGPDKGYKTPARETDARGKFRYFYFDQEDYLHEQQKTKQWNWSVARPDAIIGFSESSFMNLGVSLAVYASILKEQGRPLIFPGGTKAWDKLREFTSAKLLARAAIWMSSDPTRENQAWNVTNGELYRWCELWPLLAKYFDMPWEGPQGQEPKKISEIIRDPAHEWHAIAERYHLSENSKAEKMCTWPMLEQYCSAPFDFVTSNGKRINAGLTDWLDSARMFTSFFNELRENRIIPVLILGKETQTPPSTVA